MYQDTTNNIGKFSHLSTRGFTIVELLIVIVVIGILAAIVIVAYNGITQRAKATGYKSDANSIVKVAEAINSDASGGYPTTNAGFTSPTWSTGTATAKLPNNVYAVVTTGTVTNSESSASGAPTTGTQTWAVYTDTATNSKYYSFKACGATTGVSVYYYDPNASSVQKVSAGTAC